MCHQDYLYCRSLPLFIYLLVHLSICQFLSLSVYLSFWIYINHILNHPYIPPFLPYFFYNPDSQTQSFILPPEKKNIYTYTYKTNLATVLKNWRTKATPHNHDLAFALETDKIQLSMLGESVALGSPRTRGKEGGGLRLRAGCGEED